MKFFGFSLVIFVVLLHGNIHAQRYGLPGIHNFNRSEYGGGTQNWAVGQSANGMMYFGNNFGLLEYDGSQWNLYPEIGLVIRSICVDDKRIYVGAFNNLGYFEENAKGMLSYHSLLPLLKNRIIDFDEIWRIHKTSYGIVFQSFKAIFIYKDNKIEIVSPRSKFHFSYYVNGILWIYDDAEGLMQYRDGKVRQIRGGDFFAGTQIWSVLPLNDDQVVIGTARNGMFRYDGDKFSVWDKPVSSLVKKYQLFSGSLINHQYFAFGTIQNGVIISDTSGQVIFEINKERGLSNNTVLCVGSDNEGNIWLGLDNGISVIHFGSPLTFIQNYFNIGSGYTSALSGGKLYLGTNQGLFWINWKDFVNPLKKNTDFHLIEGTEGQVWSLTIIDHDLLCGHHQGVFQIMDDKAVRISSVPGGWNMIKISGKSHLLLVGNYSGISVLKKNGTRWSYRNELAGYDQSSRCLSEDSGGDIWISHGYKGLFRIKPDPDFRKPREIRFYDTRQGLPSNLGNTLFTLKTGIVVGTRYGIYRFDESRERFEPDVQLNQQFPEISQIDYLQQDNFNNIWYFIMQKPGVLRYQEDGAYTNIVTPFVELAGMVIPAFGHVNALDAENAIIGIEGGFAHYNSGRYKYFTFTPILHISRIQSGDTTEGIFRFNSFIPTQEIIPRFRFDNNAISISFAASQYAEQKPSFQYMLAGFDKDWSAWSDQNAKGYTNLPAGDYSFKIRAMTVQGKITPALSYKFRILPPWYQTIYAWMGYMLIVAVLLFLAYRFFLRSLEKSRLKAEEVQRSKYRQREQEMKEKSLITEREMISLRNEKLNLEMIHKEKELANSTMMIIQKNEILNKLRNDLHKIRGKATDEHLKNDLGATIKKIGKEIDNEKQWQVFNTHVEQVHEELFKTLKVRYPDLTPRELSLCAYLRMNISSKEIASLMNISTRGIEISRYRIRKKLGLDRNANLTEFMMSL